jgi:PAS domain S-box-containing protein
LASNGWFTLRDSTGAIRAEPLRLVSRAEFGGSVPKTIGDTVELSTKGGVGRFVEHPPSTPLQPGDEVEAVGVLKENLPRGSVFTDTEYKVVGRSTPPAPRPISIHEALTGRFDAELVRMTARVIDHQSVSAGSLWVETLWLQSGETSFEAYLLTDQPMQTPIIRDGYVEVTGLCVAMPGELQHVRSIRLFLRNASDLRLTQGPTAWTSPPVLRIAAGAGMLMLIGLAWVYFLRRQVAQRTAELSASEERFSKAFRGSSVTLAILDAVDGRYLDVNDAFLRAYGYSREEVIGRTSKDLGLWERPDQRDEAYRRYQRDGVLRDFESYIHTHSGERRVVLQSGDYITIGRRQCILSAGQDITERKRAEAELLRSLAREKELGEMKSNFVSMVSHEYRNPLEIVQSSSDILQRYSDRLTPEKTTEHFLAIRQAVQRMSHMLDEVLLLGKVEAGRMQFVAAPVDLLKLCERWVSEVSTATERRCPIQLEFPPEFPTTHADERLLEHIFTNLLSNAVKYSAPGQNVRFNVAADGTAAVFQVEDHGCGIPKEDQGRLFQSFHRARNVRQISGTGLGLVIVKRCVELHGGQISFTSREGEGTTFKVVLRLSGEAGDAGQAGK